MRNRLFTIAAILGFLSLLIFYSWQLTLIQTEHGSIGLSLHERARTVNSSVTTIEAEDKTAEWTEILAFFILLLVIVTSIFSFVQFKFLGRAEALARISAEAANKAAEATRDIAAAAIQSATAAGASADQPGNACYD
jgi:hypothetical protein